MFDEERFQGRRSHPGQSENGRREDSQPRPPTIEFPESHHIMLVQRASGVTPHQRQSKATQCLATCVESVKATQLHLHRTRVTGRQDTSASTIQVVDCGTLLLHHQVVPGLR